MEFGHRRRRYRLAVAVQTSGVPAETPTVVNVRAKRYTVMESLTIHAPVEASFKVTACAEAPAVSAEV